jgi:hypothetical protein
MAALRGGSKPRRRACELNAPRVLSQRCLCRLVGIEPAQGSCRPRPIGLRAPCRRRSPKSETSLPVRLERDQVMAEFSYGMIRGNRD